MEKLPMCRICLVQNVRMFVVVNRNLHELYEKLTDIPFVTEDSRPIHACFFCCTKLKKCYRLLRQCLQAEVMFAQMMNEDFEPKPIINQDHFEFCSGLIKSPIMHISIDDFDLGLRIEPKEEHQSDELELQNLDNSCLDVADIPPHDSESNLEYDVPLMEFKIEVETEEREVSTKKRRACETERVADAKKPKQGTRRTQLEDATSAEPTNKDKSDSKAVRAIKKRTSEPGTSFKEPHQCDQRSFNQQHTSSQIDEKPYKCYVCERSFNNKYGLKKHIRMHTGEKPYKCDVCQRSFRQKRSLSHHVHIHTGGKPYKCDVCPRSFIHKVQLKKHIRIHTDDNPYKCVDCQRSFNNNCELIKHIRTHTGEKPYKCDICQRSFSQKSSLSQHIRIHTGEKPCKCDVCPRSFSQKADLKKHMRIHTGEKPFKCDVCQRSFSEKSNLTRHALMVACSKMIKTDGEVPITPN